MKKRTSPLNDFLKLHSVTTDPSAFTLENFNNLVPDEKKDIKMLSDKIFAGQLSISEAVDKICAKKWVTDRKMAIELLDAARIYQY